MALSSIGLSAQEHVSIKTAPTVVDWLLKKPPLNLKTAKTLNTYKSEKKRDIVRLGPMFVHL